MSTPTAEQIAHLPKWAQDHIAKLERERSVSVRALNEYLDNQTESPFRYWDLIGTGEKFGGGPSSKTHFVQTNKMEVHWAGIELAILIREKQQELDLQWCASAGRITEVALIPQSFQSVRLKARENMR